MRPVDAGYVHSALAHTLLGPWSVCPRSQQVIQSEIEGWALRPTANREEYLQLLTDRLRTGGVDADVAAVLGQAPGELARVEEHLRFMFETARGLVQDSYQAWADWQVPGIQLEIAARTKPVYPDQANFGELGIVACVPPRAGTDPAIVKLTLVPSRLGTPSWACVPYLLCHELVCHVNQAAPLDSLDPFAEGWMDFVAWQLHDEWADQLFPWAPAEARKAARSLSETVLKRWRDLPEPHMATRAARSLGRLAAEFVESKLQPFDAGRQPPGAGYSQPDDGQQAFSLLARLSLQLNRVPAELSNRVSMVDRILKARDSSPSSDRYKAHLMADLRRWLAGDDEPLHRWLTDEAEPPKVLSFR